MEDVVMMCGQGVVCRVVGLRKGEDKGGYIGRTRGGGVKREGYVRVRTRGGGLHREGYVGLYGEECGGVHRRDYKMKIPWNTA